MNNNIITDMLGREIKVGDTLAVGFRSGNTGDIRIGKVTGFSTRKQYEWDDILVDLIDVEWDSRTSHVANSKIEARTKRAVVVNLP